MLRREVAFLAIHVHWSYEVLMGLEHRERRDWVRRVGNLLAPTDSPPTLH